MEEAAKGEEELRCRREAVGMVPEGVVEGMEPTKDVEIPNSSWGFFNVGFQVVDGVVIFGMPLVGEPAKAAGERFALAVEKTGQLPVELLIQGFVTGKETFVNKTDVEFNIIGVKFAAFRDSSYRLTHPETSVPELLKEVGEEFRPVWRQLQVCSENQQVDIGAGEELPPSEAADSGERESIGKGGRKRG